MSIPNLVVVDDSRMARMQAETLVRMIRPDWSTRTVDSGDHFLEEMAAGCDKPAVMLVDYNMPGTDGLAVAQQVRAKWPDTFLVLLTANVQRSVKTAAEEIGARFLAKPITPEKLDACLAEWAA